MKLTTRLVSLTQPVAGSGIPDAEALLAYCARVSSPQNQDEHETAERLLAYCVRKAHWSVFEMVDATVEVEVPRDISRQAIRHASFRFQEFSQRYSDRFEFTVRDVRAQHPTNRQASVDEFSPEDKAEFAADCEMMTRIAQTLYTKWQLRGAAKECARVFLPEGLTVSRFYMKGSLRSWIHYLAVREEEGSQLEHQWLATAIRNVLLPVFEFALKKEETNG